MGRFTTGRGLLSALFVTISFAFAAPMASAQTPGAFSKVGPVQGATGVLINPTVLSWEASTNATSYEYCVSVSASCFTYTPVGNVLSVNVGGLGAATTFSWQVRAINANGTTYANGSTYWSFTTLPGLARSARSARAISRVSNPRA